MTPFGPIDDEMHGSIRDILVEVAELGRLPVVTFCAGGIAAPADAASIAALAICSGVTGMFGCLLTVSPDPVTAHEIMTSLFIFPLLVKKN